MVPHASPSSLSLEALAVSAVFVVKRRGRALKCLDNCQQGEPGTGTRGLLLLMLLLMLLWWLLLLLLLLQRRRCVVRNSSDKGEERRWSLGRRAPVGERLAARVVAAGLLRNSLPAPLKARPAVAAQNGLQGGEVLHCMLGSLQKRLTATWLRRQQARPKEIRKMVAAAVRRGAFFSLDTSLVIAVAVAFVAAVVVATVGT